MDHDFITVYENGHFQSRTHISEFSDEEAFRTVYRRDKNGNYTDERVRIPVKTIQILLLSKNYEMITDGSKPYLIRIEYLDENDVPLGSVLLGPSNPNKEDKQQSNSK